MKVEELSRAQLTALKVSYLTHDRDGERPLSWGEVADVDSIVTDAEVKEFYQGVEFSPEDF
jgi:hypothetical protein